LFSAGNTSQVDFFYFECWLVLRDIAYCIMICKCFQILCLLLLLNFQQLLVYIFVCIHLEGILFHILVLTLLYYVVLPVKL